MQIDLRNLRDELHRKIQAIDLLLGGRATRSPVRKAVRAVIRQHRTMSAAGRARIAAAARARWRKAKAAGRNAL